MANSEYQLVARHTGRVVQTVVSSGFGLFALMDEWRSAPLVCGALGFVVLWVWARRQRVLVSGSSVVLQNLCFAFPVGAPKTVDLGDVTEVTLYVRHPRKGNPSTRRLYFYKGTKVIARTMGLTKEGAGGLLDAIEALLGKRPLVSHDLPWARVLPEI